VPDEVKVRALLEKYVGKEAGDSIAANIEPMIGAKKSAAEIEEVFKAGISAYYEKQANAAYTEFSVFLLTDVGGSIDIGNKGGPGSKRGPGAP
jgi:hypothetical protein